VLHQNPSFQLPLFPDFEEVLAQINRKRRKKKFRLSERRLEAIGGYRHITGGDDDQSLRLLETFLKQKPARLAAQGLPNVFADAGVRAFLARLAMTRSDDGKPALELHGIELAGGEHEGTIIAVAGLTRKDQHVTCQFGSIDETVAADASAGELLFYRMIEQAAKDGDQVFDFGVGDQLYKRSWCPVRTDLVDCYVPLSQGSHCGSGVRSRDHRQTRNQDLACARQCRCLVAGAHGATQVKFRKQWRAAGLIAAPNCCSRHSQVKVDQAAELRDPSGLLGSLGVMSNTFSKPCSWKSLSN
jgi:CelD/BcsL family acetyltransferase involved in cellulose biosynthesis